MRAAIFKGAGQPLVIENLPDPKPGREELLVKIGRCGVCGTDLHLTSGHGSEFPIGSTLGHEYAGEIIEVGSGVERFRVGDRIAALPSITCGCCVACLSGRPMSCPNIQGNMGGFAEFITVPEKSAHRLPAGLSLADGALVEPLSVGLRGVVLAQLEPGMRILVLGAGSVGLTAIFWARRLGAGKIVAASPSRRRERLAVQMGADGFETFGPNESDAISAALGGPADVVLECVGAVGMLSKAVELVRTGGLIVSLGYCTQPDPVLPSLATYKEITMKFSFAYTNSDFIHSIATLDKGYVDPRMMISETVSLDAFPAALESMRDGAPQTKLHVDPWLTS